jgi:hypothetical protein
VTGTQTVRAVVDDDGMGSDALNECREDTSSTRSPASVAGLVEVTEQVAAALVKELGVIEVELGGALVRVRGEVDGETLARVLGAMGGRR